MNIFPGKRKRCWNCGAVTITSYNPIYCTEEKRIYKYIFWGKCDIPGAHTHHKCGKCGRTWVCTPIGDKWSSWQRNVVDKYKDWDTDNIKNDLINKSLPCAVLCCHIEGDFNISNIIRTCNSFGIVDFFYYGKKHLDKRGCCGANHYLNIINLSSLTEVLKLKDKYSFIGIENNIKNTITLNKFNWKTDKNPIIIFGEENSGIDNAILKYIDYFVEIESCGSIRSLNVASAASIIIYDYYRYFRLG